MLNNVLIIKYEEEATGFSLDNSNKNVCSMRCAEVHSSH